MQWITKTHTYITTHTPSHTLSLTKYTNTHTHTDTQHSHIAKLADDPRCRGGGRTEAHHGVQHVALHKPQAHVQILHPEDHWSLCGKGVASCISRLYETTRKTGLSFCFGNSVNYGCFSKRTLSFENILTVDKSIVKKG